MKMRTGRKKPDKNMQHKKMGNFWYLLFGCFVSHLDFVESFC